MSDNDINLFAETDFRNQRTRFGIKENDRRRHMYIIGKTGMGKTTLLENMAAQDIQNGKGLVIIDPHGEFAEKMLDFVPSHRVNDIVYFDPSDTEYPIAFNAFEKVSVDQKHLVASGLMGVFKKLWPDVWSARMEYLLMNCILALLEVPNATLLGINRLLADKVYRKKIVSMLADPMVKFFWVDEFAKYTDKFASEAVAPIQNKVGQFTTNALIRNIIGQPQSTINIREIMDQQKILILNLSKGKIGEDNMKLLGSMMVTRLYLAAMGRVNIPEEERKDFYLYVDEFQNFATDSFSDILSEARKYRLDLILAHQYITQMAEKVRDAVFGNVGTMIAFRVGAADAEFLEKEFSPEFVAGDIENLRFANIYLRLLVDGIPSRPFSAKTLPPIARQEKSNKETILKVSRERYGNDKKIVEENISKWLESKDDEGGAELRGEEIREVKFKRSERPLYDAICSRCGNKTQVVFKPDPKRGPIYCRECLDKIKSGGVVEQPQSKIKSIEKTVIQDKKNFLKFPSIKKGLPSVKDLPKETISLDQLKFSSLKNKSEFDKKKKSPDIDGLREILDKTLKKENKKISE